MPFPMYPSNSKPVPSRAIPGTPTSNINKGPTKGSSDSNIARSERGLNQSAAYPRVAPNAKGPAARP